MKQVKPYLFWIISGVVVLIEIGLILFWPITDEQGNSPETVKTNLDGEFKNLEDLHKRAGAGDPPGVFDAERAQDIKDLTEKYLLTERWAPVLSKQVDKYKAQLADIKKDLTERSAVLRQPIADSSDRLTWYTAYEGKTKEILLSLKNSGSLVLEDMPADPDLETDEKVRAIAGFFTRGADNPEASQHPLLTARCRILEKLAEVVVKTRAKVVGNPVVKAADDQLDRPQGAAISAVEWKQGEKLTGDIEQYATAYELNLTLQGPTSALVAVEGAIERISSPVMVVTDGSLGIKSGVKPGERKRKSYENEICKLHLLVLDFTKANAVPAVSAPVEGKAK